MNRKPVFDSQQPESVWYPTEQCGSRARWIMKIVLIEAGQSTNSLAWHAWAGAGARFGAAPLGLVSLASVTPSAHTVEIIDEKVDGPADDVQADLIGISFKTMYADRAYALADHLRSKGQCVILGGIHTTLCPDEAAGHADAIVVGEAESLFPSILQDAEAGRVKPVYRVVGSPPPIHDLPAQRFDLIDQNHYLVHSVQSARGCSLDCEFCPTRIMFGDGFRLRRPESVISDIKTMLRIESKPLLFSDDVFGAGCKTYIEQITTALKKTAVPYIVICDHKMLTPEIVSLLAQSGCRVMTLNLPGTCSPEEAHIVHAIQSSGIHVLGYFMLGFEIHTNEVFRKILEFVKATDMRYIALTIMSPYPGTPMGERLSQEGRILSRNWQSYDQCHVVFQPAGMTAAELEAGYKTVVQEIGDRYNFERLVADLNAS